MGRFAQDAQQILEAAESAAGCSDMTILIGPDGIRMIAGSDWPLDSLLRHHGARTAYRVSGRHGSVRVEAREGARRCVLESQAPSKIAHLLLS